MTTLSPTPEEKARNLAAAKARYYFNCVEKGLYESEIVAQEPQIIYTALLGFLQETTKAARNPEEALQELTNFSDDLLSFLNSNRVS